MLDVDAAGRALIQNTHVRKVSATIPLLSQFTGNVERASIIGPEARHTHTNLASVDLLRRRYVQEGRVKDAPHETDEENPWQSQQQVCQAPSMVKSRAWR